VFGSKEKHKPLSGEVFRSTKTQGGEKKNVWLRMCGSATKREKQKEVYNDLVAERLLLAGRTRSIEAHEEVTVEITVLRRELLEETLGVIGEDVLNIEGLEFRHR
jgi:hypothetical protein